MDIAIVGAPVDLGQDRRGVDMGPSAIRYADLERKLTDLGHTVTDCGNVQAPVPESMNEGSRDLKYLEPIVVMAGNLAGRVGDIVQARQFPLVLGGDHCVSLGSVSGVTRHRSVGVIWLDAHGDFNVPSTSPSGNIHGMVLAALAGRGDERLVNLDGRGEKVAPGHIALIGIRDVDPGERSLLRSSGVHVFTMHDVDRMGISDVVDLAMDRIGHEIDGIHLSLDLDAVDPLYAPGVGTPVVGGLTYRETHLALEMLARSGQLVSMDIVEVNPVLDRFNETASLAVEFALSALGKRIM